MRDLKGHPHLAILPAILLAIRSIKLGCSRRGYCWQLIASNIPSTSSNIARKIKGLEISFCLILMPNFEFEEVNLSFNFLHSFLNMSQPHEPTFSVTNITYCDCLGVRINYPHDVILNVMSLSDNYTVGQK